MPYVIITNPCRCEDKTSEWHDFVCPCCVTDSEEIRRAVATLEEARQATKEIVDSLPPDHSPDRDWSEHYAAAMVDESGGTIGPLPDGTVIEVEQVEWLDLYAALDASSDDFGGGGREAEPKIIDVYNARQTA